MHLNYFSLNKLKTKTLKSVVIYFFTDRLRNIWNYTPSRSISVLFKHCCFLEIHKRKFIMLFTPNPHSPHNSFNVNKHYALSFHSPKLLTKPIFLHKTKANSTRQYCALHAVGHIFKQPHPWLKLIMFTLRNVFSTGILINSKPIYLEVCELAQYWLISFGT